METKNKSNINVEVLEERIANVSKKLDEQVASSKTSVDAALTAIQVAKSDQERTVTVAFAASQAANTKTEQAQKESNQAISILQNDVVSLKESRSQGSGKDDAKNTGREQSNFNTSLAISIGFNILMFLLMIWQRLGHV